MIENSDNKKFPFGQLILFIVALILIYFGTKLALQEKIKSAGLIYGIGILCLTFSFLSKFKKFKGFGFEGELWEDKMEEAEALINDLKDLELALAKFICKIAPRLGRTSSHLTRKEINEITIFFRQGLRKNNFSEEAINDAIVEIHNFNMRDQSVPILDYLVKNKYEIEKQIREEMSKIKQSISVEDQVTYNSFHKKLQENGNKITKIRSQYGARDYREVLGNIENLINDTEILPENKRSEFKAEYGEILEDLKYYAENLNFRRLDYWLKDDEEDNE